MSRTKRRKQALEYDMYWCLTEYVRVPNSWQWVRVPIPPKTKEYKKALAEYHSDAFRNFKEPGPSWYRNLFAERPQRRTSKHELHKFMLDEEYEVMLNPKDKLPYWT